MDKQKHPNFIKSSNLILGSAGLGLMNFFFSSEILNNGENIFIAVITILFIIGLGFLVRQGKSWVKYLLLVLTIFGLIGIPFIMNNIIEKPVVGMINILQTIMQVWAMILLFRIPKIIVDNSNDNNSTENK